MSDGGRVSPTTPRARVLRLGAGTRIVLLVIAAFVPLLALHAYSIVQITDAQTTHLQHDVEDLADAVSLVVAGVIDTARSTVLALSAVPAFTEQDPAAASEILASTLAQHPEFINLWAADADGNVYATALPAAEGPAGSIAAELYFRQALESGQPAVQTVRGIPQRPQAFAPVVAVPVRLGGTINGTLQVAFRLVGLAPLAQHVGLPTNSVVTVADESGTIISRSLQPELWDGVSVANTAAWAAIMNVQQGTFEGPDVDGVVRLQGVRSVPGTGWKAVVGLPLPEARAVVDTALTQQLALFGLILVVAGVVAWRSKLLADRLDTEQRRLRGVVGQLPEGILLATPDERVLVANRALESLLQTPVSPGRSTREQLEPNTRWFFGGREIAWEELPLERARRGEVVQGAQLAIRRRDGSFRDVLINALPLRDGNGAIEEILVVAADITPLKDLDRAKDEFISIAAHELRNPLAALKGYTEILLRQGRERGYDQETLRILSTIDQQADRLAELISRLLDVSRLQLGRLTLVRQPTDLAALAREVAQALQLTTTKHRIAVETIPEQIVVDADPGMLRQVFGNLIGNAIKYAPDGLIAIRAIQEGRQASTAVSDQGPGIPPEQLPHLFERFRQVALRPEQRAGGLGLGLYLSRGIVEAHGGRIGARSQVGRGSTFWFTLPFRAGETAGEPSPEILAQAEGDWRPAPAS